MKLERQNRCNDTDKFPEREKSVPFQYLQRLFGENPDGILDIGFSKDLGKGKMWDKRSDT